MNARHRRGWKLGALVLGLTVLLVSTCCVFLQSPPMKVATPLPVSTASPAATAASNQFWTALHGDNFAALPGVIAALAAADRATPNDPTLAMLLGMSYAWINLEQDRADAPHNNPAFAGLVAQSGNRAAVYLENAQKLAPNDRIVPGFVAAVKFVQARGAKDEAAETAAYDLLVANTKAYPQFQGFVQGWVLTALYTPDNPRYAAGFDGYFDSLDTCVGFKVSREDPNAPGFVYNILSKADPACYNTDIAPHNLEGTFLGLGDAYAKQGQLPQAKAAYKNAQNTPSYAAWKYKNVVENRLAQLDKLQAIFVTENGPSRVATTPAMFFQSAYSCSACHAQ